MQYHVQDPQGNSRIIEGPDGATDEEIISHAQDLFGQSGGMPSAPSSPIDKFRQYMSTAGIGPKANSVSSAVAQQVAGLSPALLLRKLITTAVPPSTANTQTPQQSFTQDQTTGNAIDTSMPDALTVQGIVQAPQALRATGAAVDSLAGATKNKFQSIMDILKAPGEAEKLAPAETELESGLAAKASQSSELNAAKGIKDALYGAIPKDVKAPVPTLTNEAENILNEIKNLPPSIQGKVKSLVSDYQDLGGGKGMALGDLGVIRSELGDIANNGEGIEKMYAARLGNALKQDVENFAKSTLVKASYGSSLYGDSAENLITQKNQGKLNRYLLDNPRVAQDGFGQGTEFEVPTPGGDTVKVYRAVPLDYNGEIRPGDFVTASPKYADYHGKVIGPTENPALNAGYKIISQDIPKRDLMVSGANELNYVPDRLPKALSQQPTEFAHDLRRMWADSADQTRQPLSIDDATQKGAYTSPSMFQAPTAPITNSDIGANIKKANSYFADFSQLQQHPVTQALNKARPEEMAAQIFRRGNVADVNVAKAVLGDGFKNLQGQFYKQIKDSKNLASYLSKQSPEFLQASFTPNQLTNLQRLAQFKALITKAKFAVTAAGAGAAIKAGEKLF